MIWVKARISAFQQLATWTSWNPGESRDPWNKGVIKLKAPAAIVWSLLKNNRFQKYLVVYFPLFSRSFISDKTSCLKPQPPSFRCLLSHPIAHHGITESRSKMLRIWEADFRLETLIFFHHLTVFHPSLPGSKLPNFTKVTSLSHRPWKIHSEMFLQIFPTKKNTQKNGEKSQKMKGIPEKTNIDAKNGHI